MPQLGTAPQPVATSALPNLLPGSESANSEIGPIPDPDGRGPLTVPPDADTDAAEPTAADAAIVLHDYYAAINTRGYARAHRLWADNGAASGQTTLQFANGFAQTQSVSVEIGAPDEQDAGAGQRTLRIPVALTATHHDGSVHRFAGSYVLHRSVVDGATPEQRSWRIRSADLRAVRR